MFFQKKVNLIGQLASKSFCLTLIFWFHEFVPEGHVILRRMVLFLVGFPIFLSSVCLGGSGTHVNLDSDGFALHGYDPVAYIENHQAVEGLKSGSGQIVSTIDGVKWAFSTTANQQKFLTQPQKYTPAYGGYCAWAMVDGDEVDVDPKSFKLIDGKVYLFYNGFLGDTLSKWNKKSDDSGQRAKADASWKNLTQKAGTN